MEQTTDEAVQADDSTALPVPPDIEALYRNRLRFDGFFAGPNLVITVSLSSRCDSSAASFLSARGAGLRHRAVDVTLRRCGQTA